MGLNNFKGWSTASLSAVESTLANSREYGEKVLALCRLHHVAGMTTNPSSHLNDHGRRIINRARAWIAVA